MDETSLHTISVVPMYPDKVLIFWRKLVVGPTVSHDVDVTASSLPLLGVFDRHVGLDNRLRTMRNAVAIRTIRIQIDPSRFCIRPHVELINRRLAIADSQSPTCSRRLAVGDSKIPDGIYVFHLIFHMNILDRCNYMLI